MIALISLLTIISLSIAVIRIGSIALELTGLSPDVASLQAQSAFSGTGFTTHESESIVSHPVRRKILRTLIMFGSAGFSSSLATLILTFVGQSNEVIAIRLLYLLVGIFVIFLITRSKFLHHILKRVITKLLERYTTLRVVDYQEVLGLSRGFSVSHVQVAKDSWMCGKFLKDLHLDGILILSILHHDQTEDSFVGAPTGESQIQGGDCLLCYGPTAAIKDLARPQSQQRA